MKRSGPPVRKKGLDRGEALKANPETTRAWVDRTRKTNRLPAMSEKRKAEKPKRDRVRQEVIARDGGCVARGLLPGRCASPFPDRPPLEVHEVISRGRWAKGYLVADNCRALCQVHHDLVTAEPDLAEKVGLSASAPQPGLTKLTEETYPSLVDPDPKEDP